MLYFPIISECLIDCNLCQNFYLKQQQIYLNIYKIHLAFIS